MTTKRTMYAIEHMSAYTNIKVYWDDDTDPANPGYVASYSSGGQDHLTESLGDAATMDEAWRSAAEFFGLALDGLACPECGQYEVRQDAEQELYAVCPCCDGVTQWTLNQVRNQPLEGKTRDEGELR